MNKALENKNLIIALLLAMTIWGISWPNAKIIGKYASYEVLIFWRFLFSAVTIFIFAFFLKIQLKPSKKTFFYALFSSMFVILYNINYFKGTQIGLAGLGGVIVPTLSPILTYLLTLLLRVEKFKKTDFFSFFIAILGGGILIRIWEISWQDLIHSGNIYYIIAAATWSIVSIVSEKAKKNINPIAFSFWIYFLSIILSTLITDFQNILTVFTFDWIFWLNFIVVSSLSVGFATTIFFYATFRLGSARAASFMFFVPLSSVIFSWLFLKEEIMISTIVGGGLMIGALYLINFRSKA